MYYTRNLQYVYVAHHFACHYEVYEHIWWSQYVTFILILSFKANVETFFTLIAATFLDIGIYFNGEF
jgi:hypothetical protein